VIPQVPGSMKRSRPARGVLESLFRAKKYVVVLAAFHPFIAGGVLTADIVGDRFNPARNTIVFSLTGEPESPPTSAEKRAYLKELQLAEAGDEHGNANSGEFTWRKFIENAEPEFDVEGQAALQSTEGKNVMELGLTRAGLQAEGAPAELQRELMVARLKQILARSRAPRISSGELREDWELLEKIDGTQQAGFSNKPEPNKQSATQ